MAASKKQTSIKVAIPQWCLDVLVSAPSQDEIEDVKQYVYEHHDVARLPDVALLCTFALMVRYPTTGGRHFGNDEIAMLGNRNPEVLRNTINTMPDVVLALQDALTPKKKIQPTKKEK